MTIDCWQTQPQVVEARIHNNPVCLLPGSSSSTSVVIGDLLWQEANWKWQREHQRKQIRRLWPVGRGVRMRSVEAISVSMHWSHFGRRGAAERMVMPLQWLVVLISCNCVILIGVWMHSRHQCAHCCNWWFSWLSSWLSNSRSSSGCQVDFHRLAYG